MVNKGWSILTKKTISNYLKKWIPRGRPQNNEDDQPLRPASQDPEVGLAKKWNKVIEAMGVQDMEFE